MPAKLLSELELFANILINIEDKYGKTNLKLKSFAPNDPGLYLQLAEVYLMQDNFKLSLENINVSIILDNRNANVYLVRGKIHQGINELELAIQDYTHTIQVNPTNAEVFFRRGEIYRKQNKLKLALTDFESAIRNNPNYNFAKLSYKEVLSKLKHSDSNFAHNNKSDFWEPKDQTQTNHKKRKEREETSSSETENEHTSIKIVRREFKHYLKFPCLI